MTTRLRSFLIISNITLSFVLIYLIINTAFVHVSSKSDIIKKFTVNRLFDTVNKSIEKNFSYYQVIVDRNLFGSPLLEKPKKVQPSAPIAQVPPPAPKQEVSAIPKPAPVKPLNLKLKGTIVGIAENSFAIIEDTARRVDEFYRINDPIKGTDAVLIDIGRNIVTLKIGDKIKYLTIYEEDENNLPAISSRVEKTVSNAPAQVSLNNEKSFVVNRSEVLESMGGDIDQIVEKVMTSVDINPYIDGGKFVGYTINNIEGVGEILTSRGFKNGDIVKEVNGIKLESPEKLFELYQTLYPELQTISSFQIVLSRNGADMTLNYTIDQ